MSAIHRMLVDVMSWWINCFITYVFLTIRIIVQKLFRSRFFHFLVLPSYYTQIHKAPTQNENEKEKQTGCTEDYFIRFFRIHNLQGFSFIWILVTLLQLWHSYNVDNSMIVWQRSCMLADELYIYYLRNQKP